MCGLRWQWQPWSAFLGVFHLAGSSQRWVRSSGLYLRQRQQNYHVPQETADEELKETVTYSHHQHTPEETRQAIVNHPPHLALTKSPSAEIVHWVSESMWPFNIVKDCGFQCLIKTSWPGFHLPSPDMVTHDIKCMFKNAQKQIAKILQVCWIMNQWTEWILIFLYRSTRERWILLPMLGSHQTKKPLLPLLSISKRMGYQSVCCWTLSKSLSHKLRCLTCCWICTDTGLFLSRRQGKCLLE